MFKELFTEAFDIEPWQQQTFDTLTQLSKKQKIAGKNFTVKLDKYNTPIIELSYGEHTWNISFYDGDDYGDKPATTIFVTTPSKPGDIKKKFSGRNSPIDKVLVKLSNFFKTNGKW